MIYARLNPQISDGDRRLLLNAIDQNDASVLESFANQSRIVHVHQLNHLQHRTLYCVWCEDRVHASKGNCPPGYTSAGHWYFRHAVNKECHGEPSAIVPEAINPENHGCYLAMGHETLPGHSRRNCFCITSGSTYCHLALAAEPPCI